MANQDFTKLNCKDNSEGEYQEKGDKIVNFGVSLYKSGQRKSAHQFVKLGLAIYKHSSYKQFLKGPIIDMSQLLIKMSK